MAAAIQVVGVGKRYVLGEARGRGSLADAVAGRLRRRRPAREELWSLRDVTFEVAEGEALGVVGRNGAGKSTLLKILSRITEPTTGVARTRGRVGALLEVGTGFHPELTGRENVYLNGAVLGMSRRAIARRMDEIVEFAGVRRFLDTPIKRYSSGMYLRLAFAVAAHLEPDILVVDEVLAVGDAEFQRKCIGKMSSVGREGRTVVFVSHDMGAVARLCARALWLDGGVVRADGPTDDVVGAYLASTTPPTGGSSAARRGGPVVLRGVRVAGGSHAGHVRRGDPFDVVVDFDLTERVTTFDVSVLVTTARGVRVLDESWSDQQRDGRGEPGRYRARVRVPGVLNVGEHAVGVWLGSAYETFLDAPEATALHVDGGDLERPDRAVCLALPWEVDRVDLPGPGGDAAPR
jgi:ABC-2 type transport system ATP-binding protein/lipopolysaccharide transport system ATP-binding protein